MPLAPTIYQQGQHAPCQHFAAAGYEHLAAAATTTEADYVDWPDDDREDDRPGAQDRWLDGRTLFVLRGPTPKPGRKPKKKPAEEPREKPIDLAGVRIDWHLALPELKIWAGHASIQTIIEGRQAALRQAGESPEGVRLIDWTLPYPTMSGLDSRTAASALDIGFSPAIAGVPIATYVAGELLAIVGMQVSPITRFGRKLYGYQDDTGQWWQFEVVEREGYHRMLSMSHQRRETALA